MQDPVSEMLTNIRNAQNAKHESLTIMSSKLKANIASVLKQEGYIEDYEVVSLENGFKQMVIKLKYYQGRPVISKIKRISKPSFRVYKGSKKLGSVAGFGLSIVSTSQGVMTNIEAKAKNLGGEVLCEVC